MAFTLAVAQTHLDAWTAADLAVSSGQAYSIGGRSLTRADIVEVRNSITYWQREVSRATAAAGGNVGSANLMTPIWR